MSITREITADMYLPEIVGQYPDARTVLDRYGLQGCGGPMGPREQVSWFARLHGVPLDQLLAELNDAAHQSNSELAAFRPSIGDTIYRPFFIAGIATVLTLGCVWGAINLLTIGLRQSFTAANYSWVLAHAHAMVFGFVGFFIIGFAYQAFPRFKHTNICWRSCLPGRNGGRISLAAADPIWSLPPRSYGRVHHDDDRWSLQQGSAHSFGSRCEASYITVADVSVAESRKHHPCIITNCD